MHAHWEMTPALPKLVASDGSSRSTSVTLNPLSFNAIALQIPTMPAPVSYTHLTLPTIFRV